MCTNRTNVNTTYRSNCRELQVTAGKKENVSFVSMFYKYVIQYFNIPCKQKYLSKIIFEPKYRVLFSSIQMIIKHEIVLNVDIPGTLQELPSWSKLTYLRRLT